MPDVPFIYDFAVFMRGAVVGFVMGALFGRYVVPWLYNRWHIR